MPRKPAQSLPKTRVRESKIHGKGLFALEDIPARSLIGSFDGPPARRNGSHVLWFQDEKDEWKGIRVTNKFRYVNHSQRANARAYGTELYALRRIRTGEEITWDYGEDWADIG